MFVDFLFDELGRTLSRLFARIDGLMHPGIEGFREAACLEIRVKKACLPAVLILRGRRQCVDRRCKTGEIHYQQKYEFASPTSHFFPFSKYANTVLDTTTLAVSVYNSFEHAEFPTSRERELAPWGRPDNRDSEKSFAGCATCLHTQKRQYFFVS